MSDHVETHYCLVAQHLAGFPVRLQAELLGLLHSYTEIFTATDLDLNRELQILLENLRQQYQRGDWRPQVEKILSVTEHCAATIVSISSPNYPAQLRQIGGAPPLLYVRGNIDSLHLPQIAMVGSRRMTRDGEANARQWAKNLANAGFTITSGLALGIDGAAHHGALKANAACRGTTIGVMATGIDRIYPQRHRTLAEEILESGGALVTEFEPGSEPLPARFPQRNRIISGLSLGVLVVEAALKSGSLITARCALGQDREVFAIPGSIHNPQAKGCHLLIKQGAQLVEQVDELVAELAGPLAGLTAGLTAGINQPTAEQLPDPASDLSEEEAAVFQSLGFDAEAIDSLSSPFDTTKLAQLLVSLELKGLIANDSGFYRRLV